MMQTTGNEMLYPLIAILVILLCYVILISYKNYMHVSGEHMGIIVMAFAISKALQIASTLIVIYWRMTIFEMVLTTVIPYGYGGILTYMGDVFVAIALVYLIMFVPEVFLKIIVSRHKKRDRQSSHLRNILDTSYY